VVTSGTVLLVQPLAMVEAVPFVLIQKNRRRATVVEPAFLTELTMVEDRELGERGCDAGPTRVEKNLRAGFGARVFDDICRGG
jgi:hypothetical protein